MTTVTMLMRTTTAKTITTKRRQRLMKKKETTTTRKDMIKFHSWHYATKCFDYNFFISIWLVSKKDIHWNSNNVRICSSDEIHWNLTKVSQWTASPANVWMFEIRLVEVSMKWTITFYFTMRGDLYQCQHHFSTVLGSTSSRTKYNSQVS